MAGRECPTEFPFDFFPFSLLVSTILLFFSIFVTLSHPLILPSPILSYYPLRSSHTTLSHPLILPSPILSYYPLPSSYTTLSHPLILPSPIRSYYPLPSSHTTISHPPC